MLKVVAVFMNMTGHTPDLHILFYGGIVFLQYAVRTICRCLNEGDWVWDRWSSGTEELVICIFLQGRQTGLSMERTGR